MRWAGPLIAALALLGCAPRDPAQQAAQYEQACAGGVMAGRLRACSAIIANAAAPAPARAEALILRGELYAADRQYTRAVGDFGRALQLAPNDIRALLQRASVHQQRSAYDAAVRDYDEVLRIAPGTREALIGRQEALTGQANAFEVELATLTREIAAAPNNAALLNDRCWVRTINNQDLELALADCEQSLRIKPNDANVLDSRGLAHYKLGRFDAALADYEAALALERQNAHYMYGRGISLIALGREAEGRAVLAQAAAIDATMPGRYRSYGVTV